MDKFSQNNEQDIILGYFSSLGYSGRNGSIGNFLDLGANDGVTLSNTWALACDCWNGVLVDASPRAFERLKKTYKGIKGIACYHLALAGYDGRITLHESGELLNSDDVALVSSVKDVEIDRFKGNVKYREIDVPCFTWESLYAAIPLKTFDFISMDIEGAELDVLPRMNLQELGVKMLCIEWNGKEELRHEYNKYMGGFKIVHENGENLIYAR